MARYPSTVPMSYKIAITLVVILRGSISQNDQENITTEAALRRVTLFKHRVIASLQFFVKTEEHSASSAFA
jgi:hypothetical protein